MTERQMPDRDPGLRPDPGPTSDPQITTGGEHPPDDNEPEGDHEKAPGLERNLDEAITRLPAD